jgi:hypothetical protein
MGGNLEKNFEKYVDDGIWIIFEYTRMTREKVVYSMPIDTYTLTEGEIYYTIYF